MTPIKPDLPPAIVLGLSPTGLHVARTLGRAGVRVIGVGDGMQSARWSRYLDRCLSIADSAQKLEALCGLFPETPQDQPGRPVLVPTSDQDVELILQNGERLGRHFAFQDSYRDGLAGRIMAKDSFYQLCAANAVSFPALLETGRDGLAALPDRLALPWMIKPARIHAIKTQMAGSKGWIVQDPDQLKDIQSDIPEGAGTLLVQEIVPGPESEITLVCVHMDRAGEARQVFTARKLRQFPPGFGSASLVQSHAEPDSAAIVTALLKALGYRGIAAAEFKRDPRSGELKIIEINVRPSLWFSVSDAARKPVVLSAYRELAGVEEIPAEQPQIDGVRWRYGLKDSWSALFYARRRGFVLPPPDISSAGPAWHRLSAVWDPRDPGPALADLANLAYKAVTRVAARVFRSRKEDPS